MSDKNTNPFVLPGMGQSSDLSGNPLLASMEMMRQAWAGLTGPGGLTQSLPMTSPTNLEDLERRITELRSVESWLSMNLSMLTSTIQGMEVQRSTIATLRSFVDSVSNLDMGTATTPGGPSPLEVVLGLKPAPKAQAQTSPKAAPEKPAQAGATPGADPSANINEQMGAAAQASRAWWDLMQQQFTQIAAATAATMPAADGTPPAAAQKPAAQAHDKAAPTAAAQPSAKPATAPRKTAAKKSPPGAKS